VKGSEMSKRLIDETKMQSLMWFLILLGTGLMGNGMMDMITKPQIKTPGELQQVYEYGYNRGVYVKPKDNSSFTNGFVKVLLGVGINGISISQFGRNKPKLTGASNIQPPARLQPKVSSQSKKEQQIKQIRKSVIEEFLLKVELELPWVAALINNRRIICVGEGGAGKSRTAMCIAICKYIKLGRLKSGIHIVDTQGAKNHYDNTWVFGNVYDDKTCLKTVAMMEGSDRTEASDHDIFVIDEAARLSRNPQTRAIVEQAMVSAKETARKSAQSIIMCSHTLMKNELGGDDIDANIRTGALNAATILYFPANESKDGQDCKSEVVLIRKGFSDGMMMPKRVKLHTAQFDYADGWEIHEIPVWFDPAYFAKQLSIHMIALGAESKTVAPEQNKQIEKLEEQIKELTVPDRMMQLFGNDVEKLSAIVQRNDIAEDFDYNIGGMDFYRGDELTDEHLNFIRYDHKSVAVLNGCDIIECSKMKSNWGRRKFETVEQFNEFLIECEKLKLGKRSNSGKYWLMATLADTNSTLKAV
jgi:hypothetical protein